MRALLDACVLVPTLTRALLMTAARSGAFSPIWSETILDEWRHAAARTGIEEAAAVDGEIELRKSRFSEATVSTGDFEVLHLPDPDDRHVLGAAITGKAEALVTFNIRDFPTRELTAHGILRYTPDMLFLELLMVNRNHF